MLEKPHELYARKSFFWTYKDVDCSQKKGKDNRIRMSVLSVICCCKLKDVRDETETELTYREKDVSHDHITDTDHHEIAVGELSTATVPWLRCHDGIVFIMPGC